MRSQLCRSSSVACRAGPGSRAGQPVAISRTTALKELLRKPGILKGPCCHDGLSARLIEKAGFEFAFMSGFCTAGARLGAPDTGLITYSEMVDTGRNVHEATRHIPIIGDGDTGYGNAMNVKRTVRGYAQAGFAGILIEDQVAPKSCGHVRGKRVTSREEAVSRIRAAVDAREEGADILIVARTDARQAESLEEALWRVAAFADAGADMLFIDALESEEEMRRFCWAGGAAARVPKMANMLEGGGKTPIMSPQQLQDLGFKLVAYPLSLLGVSIRAMESALSDLKQGVVPGPDQLGSFESIQEAVGFSDYYKEEARYAIALPSSSHASTTSKSVTQQAAGSRQAAAQDAGGKQDAAATRNASTAARETTARSTTAQGASKTPTGGPSPAAHTAVEGSQQAAPPGSSPQLATPGSREGRRPDVEGAGSTSQWRAGETAEVHTVVEADVVLETPTQQQQLSVVSTSTSKARDDGGEGGSGSRDALKRPRFFRVVITEQGTNVVKLETRIPAGFLSGLTALVPSVQGINIESMIERAMRESKQGSADGALVSLPTGNDLLQVFLEY